MLFYPFSCLSIFLFFCDVLFYGTYQLTGVGSLVVVLTHHIWWEIPTCNDYVIIYGGKSQPAMTMMSYMVGNPNWQWIMMSLHVI